MTVSAEVVGIHLAPGTRLPMRDVDSATLDAGKGLVGDRYHGSKHRHVSVQSLHELAEAAADFGGPISPNRTRRNITISAGRLPRDPGHQWRIGDVVLEVVRDAAPCRMLDMELGDGARTALRRRAGVICRVLTDGDIRLGDAVEFGPDTVRG